MNQKRETALIAGAMAIIVVVFHFLLSLEHPMDVLAIRTVVIRVTAVLAITLILSYVLKNRREGKG